MTNLHYKLPKFFLLLISILILVIGSPVSAQTTLSLAPHIIYFDFREFDDNGDKLLKESGYIPGIEFVINRKLNEDVIIESNFQFSKGEVDYDGQTQSGNPLTTNTDETFYSVGGKLAKKWNKTNPTLVYGKFEYKRWDRDIESTSTALGLSEIYSWWQLGLGVDYSILKNNSGLLGLDFQLFRTINPEMEVDLRFLGAGEPVLDLGEKTGWQMELSWQKPIIDERRLIFSVLFRTWEFGRSDDKIINTFSGPGSVHEPASESEILMFQLTIERF